MAHPVLKAIRADGFTPLGWFEPDDDDGVPDVAAGSPARFVMLVGNAGPAMFDRFAAECDPDNELMDDWCREVLPPLAAGLGARAVFPFEKPHYPFLRWAQKAKAGYPSKLGMNIHPEFGLWHAFRAAFILAKPLDLPPQPAMDHPCDACADQPCLSACPVSAFDSNRPVSPYDVDRCVVHLDSGNGDECHTGGCLARLACPVGPQYRYAPRQMQFHLSAFWRARTNNPNKTR